MIEKVNPSHPDKVADRIAGAIVDMAYKAEENPKIAVEVLVGHGVCHVIIETTSSIDEREVADAIDRIAGDIGYDIVIVPQDAHLAENQEGKIRCGDNGIFKGLPLTEEQKELSSVIRIPVASDNSYNDILFSETLKSFSLSGMVSFVCIVSSSFLKIQIDYHDIAMR